MTKSHNFIFVHDYCLVTFVTCIKMPIDIKYEFIVF